MKLLREYLILTILFVVFQPVGYAPRAVAAYAPDAPPAAPVDPVPECTAINTATVNENAVIVVFRCEPDEGWPYLINSLGFMLLEE